MPPASGSNKQNKLTQASGSIDPNLEIVKDNAEEINQLIGELHGLGRTSVETAIRIGELLEEQRKACRRGEWLTWLKTKVNCSQSTANRWMRLYQQRGELVNLTNCGEALRLLPATKRRKQKKEAKELSSEEADAKWLQIIKKIPERQWPQIAGAATSWVRHNADLLKEINSKYNTPRTLPFKR